MQKFNIHTGVVAPMDRENVDTDAIIPKQFLKSIRKTGFGPNLFDEWRYLDAGFPGQDPASRKPNPDFILNQSRYQGASILLARKNFGCGSSREHAPWALINTASAPFWRQASLISFSITVLKTVCYRLFCRRQQSPNCLTKPLRSLASSSLSTCQPS
jgi:hypothetical protein